MPSKVQMPTPDFHHRKNSSNRLTGMGRGFASQKSDDTEVVPPRLNWRALLGQRRDSPHGRAYSVFTPSRANTLRLT